MNPQEQMLQLIENNNLQKVQVLWEHLIKSKNNNNYHHRSHLENKEILKIRNQAMKELIINNNSLNKYLTLIKIMRKQLIEAISSIIII